MSDHSLKKRFTIAFIHRNGFNRLKAAIDSVLPELTKNDEVFVIDNHSNDGSIERINSLYPEVTIIKNTCNTGYARPCNQAMQQGSGEYCLLCNNDIELPKSCLNEFEDIFNNYLNAGIVGGQLIDSDGHKTGSYANHPTFLSELDLVGRLNSVKRFDTVHEVGTLRGACLAARREAIDASGMMDEDFFFYFEETEWCVRIARHGWQVLTAPQIHIVHAGGDSTKAVYHGSRIEFFRSRLLFWHKIFPKHIVAALYLWNIPKLIVDGTFYLIATILTFGTNTKVRNKLVDRVAVISWLLLGKPNKWGLPDKC